MRKFLLTSTALAIAAFALVPATKAGTLLNTFDTPFDYVANGIVGDTNWDGIYMRFGDVAGGNAGGSGNGTTLQANTTFFPGFLGIQSQGGDWSAAGDDGFFIYKFVEGDFDVSVQSVPAMFSGASTYDNRANNFSGLLVRAYQTNNSGAPFSTTSTNASENWLAILRMNQYGFDYEIRRATNGANAEYTFPTSGADIATPRYFRITRVGNVFTFYVKTNLADAWSQATNGLPASGTLVRNDWTGVPLQVGIAQAPFTTAARDVFFDDFQLTGPNVTSPALPTAPSNLISTATNTGGSLTFAWTKGSPADNSLVVVSSQPIQHNPIQGRTYVANSAYGSGDALLGGGREFAVYNGSGSSVTVTNLGANNITYYAAVFEYSGSGTSTAYNTEAPATNAFAGPGVITSATVAAATNSIPVNGAVVLRLIASFSTGETSDQTANTTWMSDNPGTADVNAAGAVSGLAVGTATITGTFGTFSPTLAINVIAGGAFANTFTATQDYLASGIIGTAFDGMFLKFGDVPGAVATGDGEGNTVTLNSQITSTNGLYMSSVQSTWQGTGNDGPFLYKVVSGDFQSTIHINTMNTLNGVMAGMMARLFNPANHGPGPNNAEYHVNYWKVQNGSTSVRRTQNGGNTTFVGTGPAAGDNWLLLQRVNSTNFYFYERADTNTLWTFVTNIVMVAASNSAPMEVGLAQQSTAGVNGITEFDYFTIEAAGLAAPTAPPAAASNFGMTLNPDLTITINYTVGQNPDQTALGSVVVLRAGGPVTAKPFTGQTLVGNSVFGTTGTGLGDGNYAVYVSPAGGTQTNHSVTVTGLAPGVVYYASVFTFTGSGATTTYNAGSSGSSGSQADGVLEQLVLSLQGSIPRGGLGQLGVQAIYTGGVVVNVSSLATVASADTNVVKASGNLITALTNGTASLTVSYKGVTNTIAATVKSPWFSDDFSANRDYLTAGTAGSGWDGLYNPTGDTNPIPDSPYVPLAGSGATVADANISSNGVLTISSAGDGWENDLSGGFFLFKNVPGDFQASVKIDSFQAVAYNQPGLLARAYGVASNGVFGAPYGTVITNANGTNDLGEYWVSLTRFDEFGIGTYARRNIDSAVTQSTQPDVNDTNYWMLIVRSQGTNFSFYKRLAATDPWRPVPNNTVYRQRQFANAPMQVGVMAGPWNGTSGTPLTVAFDQFMIDVAGGSILHASIEGSNLILSWPAVSGTLQRTSSLNPVDWQPVPGTPTLGADGYSLTVPIGTGNQFFRLQQ